MNVSSNTDQCEAQVYPDMWGALHPHRCTRKVWADNFCKQHHPMTIATKQKNADKHYEERKRNPLLVALEEIQKLRDILINVIALADTNKKHPTWIKLIKEAKAAVKK